MRFRRSFFIVSFLSLAVPFDTLQLGFVGIERGFLGFYGSKPVGLGFFLRHRNSILSIFLHHRSIINSAVQFISHFLVSMSMESTYYMHVCICNRIMC